MYIKIAPLIGKPCIFIVTYTRTYIAIKIFFYQEPLNISNFISTNLTLLLTSTSLYHTYGYTYVCMYSYVQCPTSIVYNHKPTENNNEWYVKVIENMRSGAWEY